MATQVLRFYDEPTAVSTNLTWTPSIGGADHYSLVSDDNDERSISTLGVADDNYQVERPLVDYGLEINSIQRVKVVVRYGLVINLGTTANVRVQVFKAGAELYVKTQNVGPIATPTDVDLGWLDVASSVSASEAEDLRFRVRQLNGPFGTLFVRITEIYVHIDYRPKNPVEKTIASASCTPKTIATYANTEKVITSFSCAPKTITSVGYTAKQITSVAKTEKIITSVY